MNTQPYECDWCKQHWTSPISANLCCDPTSFADTHDDRPTIYRGLE